ncbi:MAG TPA: hypothetical protein VGV59_10940 [Pyrinomonadaceae bacterium]|nr:hypothetical protein [Pyrinomonadaceae bacterium]
MLSRLIAPMRSTVGAPLPFETARVTTRSTELQLAGGQITLNVYDHRSELQSLNYKEFFPEKLGLPTVALTPAAETFTLPRIVDFPFEDGRTNFIYLSARLPPNATVAARALSFEVDVRFGEEVLLGGLCYGGHPSLPYYVNQQGENSSNFGLPRELRVRWKGHDRAFIDDETAITYQEPTSHGGVHYLCTGPVKTDWLILKFSDFPKFIRVLQLDAEGNVQKVEERYGLLMPYLCFFSHREETRFRPRVPAGLLATLRRRSEATSTAERRLCADLNHASGNSFLSFSGASIFGQRRAYPPQGTEEVFCSVPVLPRDALDIYVEQLEEQTRCVAGIRIKFARFELPGVAKRTTARLRIYELDPPDGGSPLNAMRPEKKEHKKYAFLLYDEPVAPAQESITCKFVRPSASRYFALVLTNEEARPTQFAIENVEFVQSVHVAVAPRASRKQTITQLHYRIIGERLADDYARLGADGFSLSVERLVAGERKLVLFSAASLLDLLQSGGARLYANQRYLETTTYEEHTKTQPGSFDEHSSRAWTDGWRRHESGAGVAESWNQLDRAWQSSHGSNPWKDRRAVTDTHDPSHGHGFNTFANTETRNHSEVIGHEAKDALHNNTRMIFDKILDASARPPQPGAIPRLLEGSSGTALSWENLIWKGIQWRTADGIVDREAARVGVISNVTIPPSIVNSEHLSKFTNQIFNLLQNPTNLPQGLSGDEFFKHLTEAGHRLLNGAAMGFSFGFSLYFGSSCSVSGPQIMPHFVYNSSAGTTGSINKQASLTGYSYSQTLHKGFEQTRVRTEFIGGEATRHITRREFRDPAQTERARGVEVKWQDGFVDIVAGTIPVGVTLPATASQSYRTADEMLLVRFGKGIGQSLKVDVWFDVLEEVVRDDY